MAAAFARRLCLWGGLFWHLGWVLAQEGTGPSLCPEVASVLAEKLCLARSSASTLSARTLAVARSFEGTPYGSIAIGAEEYLEISTSALDCWTLVELSLAVAIAAREEEASPDKVVDAVRQLRYWGGTIEGYASRIHYLSGWLRQAQDLGYLRDITAEIGGRPFRKNICYMTSRVDKYPLLRDPQTLQRIRQVETRLSRRTHYYIPQQAIERAEPLLREGDIIAITSAQPGLDYSHLGFAVQYRGRIHLLHASSLKKRVIVSAQPLGDYVRAQKGQSGITVVRLVDAR